MKNSTSTFRVKHDDFSSARYGSASYETKIPAEVALEDLLRPEAWVGVLACQKVLPGSFIRCVKADLSAVYDLLVIGGDKKGLLLELFYSKDFRKSEVLGSCGEVTPTEEDSEYKIVFSGPNKKHVIIRKSDNEEIEIGISSKKQALEIIKTLSK